MEDVFGSADDDGVAGVVSALGTHDDVGVFCEEIDDFAFAFIAPLGADKNGVCHRTGWMSRPGPTDGPKGSMLDRGGFSANETRSGVGLTGCVIVSSRLRRAFD